MPKEEDEKQEKIELEKLEKPILTSMLDVQYLLKIETEPLRFDKTMTENLKIGLTLGQATDGFCGFIDLFIKIADGKLSLNDNIEIPAEDLKELKYMSEQFKANSSLQGRLPTDKQVDDFTEKQITNLDKYGHIYLIYINRNGKHGNAIRYDKEIINGKPVITKTFYNLGAGTVGDNVMAGGLEAIGKLLRQETVDPAITYLVDEKHYKDAIKRDIVNSVNASYKKVKTPSRGGSEKNIEFLHSSGKDVVIQQHGTCSVKCMFEATRGAVSEHTFHSFTDLVYNSSFDGESLVPTFITPLQRQDYNKYYEILSEEKQTVTDLCFNKIWSKFPDIKSLVESSMLMTGLVSKFYKEIFPPMEISNNKDEELTKNAFSSIKESFLKVIEHNGGTLREDNFKKVLKDVREDIKTNPSISNDLKKSMIITEQQQKFTDELKKK